ncbi:hypothetical protein KEM09_09670 [Carboxylicivirga mesophila]|uniref:Uncharacterized protein n=1 Tax=Carboxylicivirga mesophila TaxID=1166478 RepID=A0ABS5K9J9_9BACT|nr:hypothetical protein [Carboxylicivirga mesophila]MBS2211671.1 hypothetical protein [Carboxylicivirga mesophila]
MDDIGNILYILAMLAALVFSAFKKQKQAKKQMPAPDEQAPTYHPMDEEDIMGELKELFQKPKVEKPKPAAVKSPVKSHTTPFRTLNKDVKKAAPVPASAPIVLEVDESDEASFFDKEQIDLRQAVIYSEILKRPYE